MGMEIAGYCVYPNTEDFDIWLTGERRVRLSGKYTVIYCENEEDAKELSGKIAGSDVGPYFHLVRDPGSDPTLY